MDLLDDKQLWEEALLRAQRIDSKEVLHHLLFEHAPPGAVGFVTEPVMPYRAHYFTPNLKRVFGLTIADLTEGRWVSRVHQDDLSIPFDAARVEHGKPIRYRFRHGDGSYVWVVTESQQLCDIHGQPMSLIGWWAKEGPADESG